MPVSPATMMASGAPDLADRILKGIDQIFARPPFVPPHNFACMDDLEESPEVRASVLVTIETMKDFGAARQICHKLNDPDVSLALVSGEISRDPVLTGRILKAASSAFYGSRSIDSVREAITLLGTRNVQTILFLHGLRGIVRRKGSLTDLVVEALWQHSVLTSVCAHHIARAFPGTDRETLFTLGLLHDIGKFVNADRFHRLADSGGYTMPYTADFTLSDERRIFGIDHAKITGLAFEHWGLAPLLVEVAAGHHEMDDPDRGEEGETVRSYGAALFVANQAAKVLAGDLYRSLFDVQSLPQKYRGLLSREAVERALLSAELVSEIHQARQVLSFD